MSGSASRVSGDSGLAALPPRRQPGPWLRRAYVFLVCALAVNALIGERGLAETLRVRKQVQRLTAEVVELRRENLRLAEFADRLATDPRTIEHLAREELGLIRKGEILVLLKDVPPR